MKTELTSEDLRDIIEHIAELQVFLSVVLCRAQRRTIKAALNREAALQNAVAPGSLAEPVATGVSRETLTEEINDEQIPPIPQPRVSIPGPKRP